VAGSALPLRLAQIARTLESRFLGKDEVIRLLLIAVVAGEHAVLVGPPGTAKSALIRMFARLIHANYFEYLLTRFTEPNEIFGPVDIAAFREGKYQRRVEGMLPTAEMVFLDEVFKSNSAILNALLTLLNERRYTSGGVVLRCPLLSCFGASNEVPTDETLTVEIRDRRTVHGAAGAGAHDATKLRNDAASERVTKKDVGVPAETDNAFLNARAA
jgi:MoxR-like ATPase